MRQSQQWMSYNGRYSYEFFAKLVSGVTHAHPEWRGKSKAPTGRDGDVFITDGTYDTTDIKVKLRCQQSHLDDISAWLTGAGLLVFSWAPDRAYDARVQKKFDYKQYMLGSDPIVEFEITFVCQPFRLLYPGHPAVEFTSAGTLENPGTAYSKPRVTIVGDGDFTVTIGAQTIYFTGIEDGIIIDSDLMDALTLDGLNLANDKISGMPWTIPPGQNEVSWAIEDGSVSSVTILPRWRYI